VGDSHLEHVQRLFEQAGALDAEERRAFLDDVCAGEDEIREEIERLLDADGTPTADLCGRMGEIAAIPPRREVVGRYRILSKLGEGGFGQVYVAEQTEPVRRRVALKIIKPGMDSASVVARFESERQALAVMDHPNIAKVFDGGMTDDGYPYFAMELVKGEPITHFCDRHRLTIEERLELFIKVCDAVQHAHMKGVIHRDIKPANILAYFEESHHEGGGASGIGIKVIDFGVAKALNQRLSEHTIFTERGQLIGTPEYMSPEQAEMSGVDIDTRSDVYSLGVLLYELLTGFRPCDLREAALQEGQRIIREGDPPRPSTRIGTALTDRDLQDTGTRIVSARRVDARSLTGALKRDLDWVVIRSLEKNRERRYDTPSALAAELRRYLDGRPVHAGPPSARYRAGKFVARNRGAVIAAATVLAVLLLGVTGTTIGLVAALDAKEAAAASAEEARRSEREAEAVTAFLADDLLAAAAPSADPGRGRQVTVREVLDRSTLRVMEESLEGGELFGEPEVQHRLATTIGRTYLYRAEHEQALEILEWARREVDHEGDEGLVRWIDVTLDIALVYEDLGDYDLALVETSAAVERALAEFGKEDWQTIAAESIHALVLYDLDRFEEAEAIYRDVLARMRTLPDYEETDELSVLNNLALVLMDTRRFDEAVELLERDIDITLRNDGQDDIELLTTKGNLAVAYEEVGRTHEALALTREVADASLELLGPEHSDTLIALENLAAMEYYDGSTPEAIALFERTFEGHNALFGDDDPYAVASGCHLAHLLVEEGETDRARRLVASLQAHVPSLLARDDADGFDAAGSLAGALQRVGMNDEAVALSERVFDARLALFGDEHYTTAEERIRHAELLIDAGRPGQAHALLDAEPPRVEEAGLRPFYLVMRGRAGTGIGAFEQAERDLTRAYDALEDDWNRARVAERLVELYETWHDAEPEAGHDERADAWRDAAGASVD